MFTLLPFVGIVAGVVASSAVFMPGSDEMRLMAERYVSDGVIPDSGDVERLTRILGRPLHSYRDFAMRLASQQNTRR